MEPVRTPAQLPDHRAVPGWRGELPRPAGVPPDARAVLPGARHSLRARRGAGQLWPHGPHVRLRSVWHRARLRGAGEGPGERGLGLGGRRAGRCDVVPGLRRRLRHLEREPHGVCLGAGDPRRVRTGTGARAHPRLDPPLLRRAQSPEGDRRGHQGPRGRARVRH